VPRTVLFNPTWEKLGEDTELEWEGCLSLPGLRGQVRRYNHIRVKALDRNGEPFEYEAVDFHARVFQHEFDHLDGVVFVDRMEDMSSLCYLREWYVHHMGIELPDEDELDEEPEACSG
jgi:peptide deformylase